MQYTAFSRQVWNIAKKILWLHFKSNNCYDYCVHIYVGETIPLHYVDHTSSSWYSLGNAGEFVQSIINPRRACVARVTVVVLCVCVSVCLRLISDYRLRGGL